MQAVFPGVVVRGIDALFLPHCPAVALVMQAIAKSFVGVSALAFH